MRKKISNLKEGDLFEYKNVIYEIVEKGKWMSTVKYPNDEVPHSIWKPYLFCSFSNYTIVNI